MVELPISQPKGPKQKYSVSTFQDGRVVPIKGNVVTRGKNVQDRPEGCIICNPPLSEIQKVCQIPVERPSILSVRIIIYLGDMLLLASSLEDLLMAIDTLIFILQHLDFLINIKNSYLEPTSTLEFLGVIVDSGEMTLTLPKEKLLKVQNRCQEILENEKVTVRELSKLIRRLSSTAIAVLPAPPPLSSSSTSTDSEINFSQLFRGESGSFSGGKERTVMVERKFNSLQQ